MSDVARVEQALGGVPEPYYECWNCHEDTEASKVNEHVPFSCWNCNAVCVTSCSSTGYKLDEIERHLAGGNR